MVLDGCLLGRLDLRVAGGWLAGWLGKLASEHADRLASD